MFNYNISGSSMIFTFQPKLDTAACNKAEDELFSIINHSELAIVFDMSGVEYISSNFLRISLQLWQKLGKDRFSVKNVSESVRKIYHMAGFDGILVLG